MISFWHLRFRWEFLATVTSVTVVGAVAGGAVAVHGADVMQAGIRQAITGEQTDTLTSTAIQAAGVSRDTANMVDTGISVVGSLGAGSLTAFAKLRVVAKEPAAKGLTRCQIFLRNERGSISLRDSEWRLLGGEGTTALEKVELIEKGVDVFGNPLVLETGFWEGVAKSILLYHTGPTPGANVGIGGIAGAIRVATVCAEEDE